MTQQAHRIRLRGPWNVVKAGDRRSNDVAVVHFPQTWDALGGEPGAYRFSRRFGCPTGVGPAEAVWLEVTSSAAGRAVLNEMELGPVATGTQSFDMTSRLRDGNQIDLELRRTANVGSHEIIVEVAVVIETARASPKRPPHDTRPSP